jgi:hypothetical protein
MQHLKTKHTSLIDSDAEFFKRKAEIVKKTRLDSCGSYRVNKGKLLPLKFHTYLCKEIQRLKTPHCFQCNS